MSQPASSQPPHDSLLWALPFPHLAWALTPPAVQNCIKSQQQQSVQLQTQMAQVQRQIEQLQHHVETLPGRVAKTSHTSSKPPSSDAPFNTPTRQRTTSNGTRGGRQGHRGNGPTFLRPTAVHRMEPGPCPCGHGTVGSLSPSHTHHVIALPPIERDIHHGVLQQGQCQGGGRPLTAQVPSQPQAGYGPRVSALIGARAGRHRTSWRLVQDCCHAVFNIPISLGAVHKVLSRVSHALVPLYAAIAPGAHQAPVGDMDATPWYCQNALQWLWIMATETGTSSRIDPHRSTEAFWALIDAWQGLLVSDG